MVITSTTGNRVAVLSGTRVRIPPTPPEKTASKCSDLLAVFLIFADFYEIFHFKKLRLHGVVGAQFKNNSLRFCCFLVRFKYFNG